MNEHHKTILASEIGKYELYIPDFDKTDMAASKVFLKIAYESIYKSQ